MRRLSTIFSKKERGGEGDCYIVSQLTQTFSFSLASVSTTHSLCYLMCAKKIERIILHSGTVFPTIHPDQMLRLLFPCINKLKRRIFLHLHNYYYIYCGLKRALNLTFSKWYSELIKVSNKTIDILRSLTRKE